MKISIILTVLAIVAWLTFNSLSQAAAPLISGQASVAQLDNTTSGYFVAKAGTVFSGSGISIIALLAVLTLIWIKPIVNGFKSLTLVAFVSLFMIGTANATILDKNTYLSEFITIKPNQTAFLIPMQGANKSTQGQFDSIAYLDANKVATKRIQIPHVVLDKAGTWANSVTADQYIPSAELYIVNREPYTRLWTKEETRGTSTKNEGTYVETCESINIDFGTVIAAEISPTNAALYMYHFGVSDQLNQGDDVNFPSVVYARNLNDIMDTVVFNDAHRMLANEFGKRTFRECISQKSDIIKTVEQQLKDTYAPLGITIRYFGLASQLNFADDLQKAVNNVAIAELDAAAATNRMAAMPVLQALADINLKNSVASAVSKWNGSLPQLPSFAVLPDGLFNGIGGLLGLKK